MEKTMKMYLNIPGKGHWEINQYLLFDAEKQEMTIFQPGLRDPVTMSISNAHDISIELVLKKKIKEKQS